MAQGELSFPSKLTLVAEVGVVILIPGMLIFFSSMAPLMASLAPWARYRVGLPSSWPGPSS